MPIGKRAEAHIYGRSRSRQPITLHQRMCFIFCFCAHGSRTNFASILQAWLRLLRYLRPIPKMRALPSALASGTTDIAGHLRFRFFLRWRVDRLASARKNSIISLMRCCGGSLNLPLRCSVACVSRVLDSGGGKPAYHIGLAGRLAWERIVGNGLSRERAADRPKPLASAGLAGRYSSRSKGEWCHAPLVFTCKSTKKLGASLVVPPSRHVAANSRRSLANSRIDVAYGYGR